MMTICIMHVFWVNDLIMICLVAGPYSYLIHALHCCSCCRCILLWLFGCMHNSATIALVSTAYSQSMDIVWYSWLSVVL